jgi:DNA-binding CsgD family transcriptional regulator
MMQPVRTVGATSRNAAADSYVCAALSNRERDVLKGLVAGHANKQIAYDLGISPRTIENYRANLMIKMQAASLSDLVRMALIAGILAELGSIQRILSDAIGCPTHPAGTFADLSHIKAAVLILVLFAAQRGYPEPRVQAKSNEKSRRIVAVGSSRHRH